MILTQKHTFFTPFGWVSTRLLFFSFLFSTKVQEGHVLCLHLCLVWLVCGGKDIVLCIFSGSTLLLSVSPEKPTCNYIYGTLPTSPVASLFFESTALSSTHYGGYSLTLQSLSECLLRTLVLCRPRSVRFRVLFPISCFYSCHCTLVIARGASGTLGDKWFLLPSGRMLAFFPSFLWVCEVDGSQNSLPSFSVSLQTRVTLLILYGHNDHWVQIRSFFVVKETKMGEGAGDKKNPIHFPRCCPQAVTNQNTQKYG